MACTFESSGGGARMGVARSVRNPPERQRQARSASSWRRARQLSRSVVGQSPEKERELCKQVRGGIDPIEQKKQDREALRVQQSKAKTFPRMRRSFDCEQVARTQKRQAHSAMTIDAWNLRLSDHSSTRLRPVFATAYTSRRLHRRLRRAFRFNEPKCHWEILPSLRAGLF